MSDGYVHPFVVPPDKAVRASAHGYFAPEVFEWLFTLAVVAFLVWQSAGLREPDFLRGSTARYREAVELRVPPAAGRRALGRGRGEGR